MKVQPIVPVVRTANDASTNSDKRPVQKKFAEIYKGKLDTGMKPDAPRLTEKRVREQIELMKSL